MQLALQAHRHSEDDGAADNAHNSAGLAGGHVHQGATTLRIQKFGERSTCFTLRSRACVSAQGLQGTSGIVSTKAFANKLGTVQALQVEAKGRRNNDYACMSNSSRALTGRSHEKILMGTRQRCRARQICQPRSSRRRSQCRCRRCSRALRQWPVRCREATRVPMTRPHRASARHRHCAERGHWRVICAVQSRAARAALRRTRGYRAAVWDKYDRYS